MEAILVILFLIFFWKLFQMAAQLKKLNSTTERLLLAKQMDDYTFQNILNSFANENSISTEVDRIVEALRSVETAVQELHPEVEPVQSLD